jgi:hypothetical protein
VAAKALQQRVEILVDALRVQQLVERGVNAQAGVPFQL